MSRSQWAALMVFAFLTAPAVAQAPNPVMEHYRAYSAALQAGDLVSAEAAAERAFAASRDRDGEGGRTAVLALNLATMRLLRDNHAGARTPAQIAQRLSANPTAGVDPIVASLVLGRAEIGTEGREAAAGARLLRESLRQSADRDDLIGEVYPAAVALGAWAFANSRFGQAGEAWTVAERTAEGANVEPALARAYAQIGVTASIVMDAAGRRMRRGDVSRAATAVVSAIHGYERLVSVGSPEDLTPTQNGYAQALGWRAALVAKLRSDSMDVPPEVERWSAYEIGAPIDARPPCQLEFVEQPRIRFPERMLNRGGIGSVIIHIRTNEEGEVVSRRVVAAVGAAFVPAIEEVETNWRMRRRSGSVEGCRLSTSVFQTVVFVIH